MKMLLPEHIEALKKAVAAKGSKAELARLSGVSKAQVGRIVEDKGDGLVKDHTYQKLEPFMRPYLNEVGSASPMNIAPIVDPTGLTKMMYLTEEEQFLIDYLRKNKSHFRRLRGEANRPPPGQFNVVGASRNWIAHIGA